MRPRISGGISKKIHFDAREQQKDHGRAASTKDESTSNRTKASRTMQAHCVDLSAAGRIVFFRGHRVSALVGSVESGRAAPATEHNNVRLRPVATQPEAPLTVQTTVADRATVSPDDRLESGAGRTAARGGTGTISPLKSAPPECLRFVGEFIRDELQNVGAGRSLLASRRRFKHSRVDLRDFGASSAGVELRVGYFVDMPLHSRMMRDIDSARVLARIGSTPYERLRRAIKWSRGLDVSVSRLQPTD